jgi:hypothetical protein
MHIASWYEDLDITGSVEVSKFDMLW